MPLLFAISFSNYMPCSHVTMKQSRVAPRWRGTCLSCQSCQTWFVTCRCCCKISWWHWFLITYFSLIWFYHHLIIIISMDKCMLITMMAFSYLTNTSTRWYVHALYQFSSCWWDSSETTLKLYYRKWNLGLSIWLFLKNSNFSWTSPNVLLII